jgi:hypothetical protein
MATVNGTKRDPRGLINDFGPSACRPRRFRDIEDVLATRRAPVRGARDLLT